MLSLPGEIVAVIQKTVGGRVRSVKPVSGGSINEAYRLELHSGEPFFLKMNRRAGPEMFAAEVRGLEILKAVETNLAIPSALAFGHEKASGCSFLLTEWLEAGGPEMNFFERFGRYLASLHRDTSDRFGLDHANFIGRLPQSNRWQATWHEFFREQRILPQLETAVASGLIPRSAYSPCGKVFKLVEDEFPVENPALLHGDLWSGNFMFLSSGRPAIFDPAVYFGHREMEIAFTHLFGGFSPKFYAGYESVFPLEEGFSDRRDIYNLYPLLVHVNLFGGSYAGSVMSILKRFGG